MTNQTTALAVIPKPEWIVGIDTAQGRDHGCTAWFQCQPDGSYKMVKMEFDV